MVYNNMVYPVLYLIILLYNKMAGICDRKVIFY